MFAKVERIIPGPGQESVWDYPRPPRLEKTSKRVQVRFHGALIADTQHAKRILETSHPPVYYIPPEDIIKREYVKEARGTSFCEWKGKAHYYSIDDGDGHVAERAAWYYPRPSGAYDAIRDHVAFYPREFECSVDGEVVRSQDGDFYGGWITSEIVGPFKGARGTMGW